MTSLFDQAIKDGVERAYAKALAPDGWLTRQIRLHVKWVFQGFEDGLGVKERSRFTETVADRIHELARKRYRLFGFRLWLYRYPYEWCEARAEEIVTQFLRDEKIKFGDPRFDWSDGRDIADEEMSYWEAA